MDDLYKINGIPCRAMDDVKRKRDTKVPRREAWFFEKKDTSYKEKNTSYKEKNTSCKKEDKEKPLGGLSAKRKRKRGKYLFLEAQAVVKRNAYLERVDTRDKRCKS